MHLNSNQVSRAVRHNPSEIRMQQLARYRERERDEDQVTKRFDTIACKALADNRPRFKGRFAR